MKTLLAGKEISIAGRLLKTARLRHEWFEFLEDPPITIHKIRQSLPCADLFTFLQDIDEKQYQYGFHMELNSASILPITTHEDWWKDIDFKVRNKIRKSQKSGVELRPTTLNDEFAKGVESIYNESRFRQGRKFLHYGKTFTVIKEDLSSFPDRALFIGAYYQSELIGFMKLFEGKNVLRTVHIIAKLGHRDKPVMDALIAKAVEICDQKQIHYLHYGSWTTGGLGAFRMKHGFKRFDVPRYFVPLTIRGELMLKLKLHHRFKDHLPDRLLDALLALRRECVALRDRAVKGFTAG